MKGEILSVLLGKNGGNWKKTVEINGSVLQGQNEAKVLCLKVVIWVENRTSFPTDFIVLILCEIVNFVME